MAYQQWSVVYGEQPSASKWNILGTNDAHFYSFLGDTEAWDTYTPTITGLTGANNTVTGSYKQIGRYVRVHVQVTLGAGFGIGNCATTVPVPFVSGYSTSARGAAGWARLVDTGSTSYWGYIRIEDSTTVRPITYRTDGTYVNSASISSTVPFTWVATDGFALDFMYEAGS